MPTSTFSPFSLSNHVHFNCQKLLHDDKGNDKFLNPDYVASLYLEKILRYLGKVYLLTWAKIDLSVVQPYCWLKKCRRNCRRPHDSITV